VLQGNVEVRQGDANPITWPFRSAKQTRSGTTIGLSCFARWSISALLSGTNPQFRSHALVVQRLDQLHFFLEALHVERAQGDSLTLRDDVHGPRDALGGSPSGLANAIRSLALVKP